PTTSSRCVLNFGFFVLFYPTSYVSDASGKKVFSLFSGKSTSACLPACRYTCAINLCVFCYYFIINSAILFPPLYPLMSLYILLSFPFLSFSTIGGFHNIGGGQH